MSGLWSGEYRYDHDGMCVRFTAMITETDGKLCGTTLEPATFGPLAGPDSEYEATIRGDRCWSCARSASTPRPDPSR